MSETTLKRIAPDANSFEANGHKYIIHSSLGVERYRHFERLQNIAGFGADYQTLHQRVSKAYDQMNKMRLADAAVTLNGVLEGVSRPINGQQHPLLLLCTLFIARESDDLTTWNEAEAAERLADWEAAGYDVSDFFRLAFALAQRFARTSAGVSLDTSEAETETTQNRPATSSLPRDSTI